MIEKKTVIDQIEITRNGTIQVRFALLVLDDGEEISSRWHRTAIEPGADVVAQLNAVDSDITTRKELKAVPIERGRSLDLLRSIVSLVHTPEVVIKHRGAISARL